MNTALLGGTFNPPHLAHLALGRAGLQVADRVIFIPAGHPPHRTVESGLSAFDRLLFTRIACGRADAEVVFDIFRDYRVFSSQADLEGWLSDYQDYAAGLSDLPWEVSDMEYRLALHRPGPTYTVDTVDRLREIYPGDRFFLLMGQDQAAGLDSWYDIERLSDMVTFCAVRRPGTETTPPAARVSRWLEWTESDISSTAIRSAIQTGQDLSAWLPLPLCRLLQTSFFRDRFLG